MSLPVGQQRILDGIAETLRISEPRLAAMFAIFTRLHRNDPRPWREQLAGTPRFVWLAALFHRLPGTGTERGRRTWRRALILTQMAIAFIALAVVVGLNSHPAASCRRAGPAAASAARSRQCTAQAGLGDAPLGK